jgi:hypothetical protein
MTHRSRNLRVFTVVALVFLVAATSLRMFAQQVTSGITAVPALVQFSGLLADSNGKPLSGLTGVTFSLYAEQEGGSPLWLETQNVQPDKTGHYTIMLGSTTSEGLPSSLFASGQARWLGVQPQGQAEQPRIMLLSVPYALKAADAETFGGKPPSAYAAAPSSETNATSSASSIAIGSNGSKNIPPITGGGTTNYVPLWTSSSNLGNSTIYQSGSGLLGIGTTNPIAPLDVINSSTANPAAIVGVSNGAQTAGLAGENFAANGFGLYGINNAKTGNAVGVSGISASTTGTGVSGTGTAGVRGTSGSTEGVGVSGIASAMTGVTQGVYGESDSTGGFGVVGSATAVSGTTAGVSGAANSGSGYGVVGSNTAGTGNAYGVYATTASNQGTAIAGIASSGTGPTAGVSGTTLSSTNSSTGVSGYAGESSGVTFGVAGTTYSATNSAAGVSGFAVASTGVTSGVAGTTYSATDSAAGVTGSALATSGQTRGVYGTTESSTNSAVGVYGQAQASTGVTFGVYGGTSSNNGGTGVYGQAGSTTGFANGVAGFTSSPGGYGVWGQASSTDTSNTAYGVYGTSANGDAVHGVCTAANCSGVAGIANTNGGGFTEGAAGINLATTGPSNGVYGTTASPDGVGGLFENTAGGLPLLARLNASTNLFIVDGGGNGTFAGNLQVNGGGSFGSNVTINGNLNVSGTLTKGGGSFKIDDPLDPANKYLSHSFVESPDMMNIYNGLVRLDARGEAWVTLPDYFEALNRDFRYQLTSVGAPQPRLYIAREITGNRFKIAGGKPNAKASWQVTGIRRDAWANAHRIPNEEEKPLEKRGTYLYPELYGDQAREKTNAMLQH